MIYSEGGFYEPSQVKGVPKLNWNLGDLLILVTDEKPLLRKIKEKIQALTYLMGDTSVIEFGLVLWCQIIIVSERL